MKQPKDYPCGRHSQITSFCKLIVFGFFVWLIGVSAGGVWVLYLEAVK